MGIEGITTMYNPVFELEESKERERELKNLRDTICHRAGRDHLLDFSKKLSAFVKRHPVTTLSMAAILGLSFATKK